MLEVRRLRQAKGWNQTELAFYSGLAPSVISQIENGKRDPSAGTLRKLANALDVGVGDLFPKDQAPLPFEDDQRRFLPYVRPWFSLFDRLSEELESIAAPGRFDAGTFLASGNFQAAAMSSMNMVLWHLKAQGIDPMTGRIGDELRGSMLRYAAAARAAADAAVNSPGGAELEKARKWKAERQADIENLPDFGKEAAT